MGDQVIGAVLVIAMAFNVTMQVRARKREHEMTQLLHRVDRVLTIWAETWGEPAADVKARLREARR